MRKMGIYERFEKKVSVAENGCWLWTGSVNHAGYGGMGTCGTKTARAHRVSYELHVGPIPDGMCVCHRCDTPACVRPGHLFLGTHQENMHDMVVKGRKASTRGELGGLAILTEALVREIRASAESTRSIARRLGTDHTTIHSARIGRTWKHVS